MTVVCDAQVHAPDLPSAVHVGGIGPAALRDEMAAAGVYRCVVVPLVAPGPDATAHNGPAMEMAAADPGRFAVMGRFDLTRPQDVGLLPGWLAQPHMLGIRLSFVRGPHRVLLSDGGMDWFLEGAQSAGIPLMVLVTNDRVADVGRIAARYPDLRLVVDHLGLTPYEVYDDVLRALRPLLELAGLPNVAVKASALPASVADPFPFRSLHAPLLRVVAEFGARRVFWGSDLTRLQCPYAECVRLFTDELPLTPEDREWVLGRGVLEWLGWTAALPAGTAAAGGSR